jgi:serine/threonine protein phosphatase 1
MKAWIAGLRRSGETAGPPPRVPEGLVVYAIGDVHGERRLLEGLLADIATDARAQEGASPVVILLGDYVDRGPDSRGVIDLLVRDPLPGFTMRFLKGNHEEAMLGFMDHPAASVDWLRFGGAETLGSYGVRASVATVDADRCRVLRDLLGARMPDEHLRFLQALETCVVYGDYAFVHAGIRPHRRLASQDPRDLLWIRSPFLDSPVRHEKIIVHGHTIVDCPDVRHNRIGIDTGAYATGVLSALVLRDESVRFLQRTS